MRHSNGGSGDEDDRQEGDRPEDNRQKDDGTMGEIRVLYVVGYGRSGSTMFNALVGKHPDLAIFGEARNLHAVAAANELCSCRERLEDCVFWNEVWKRWRERAGADLVDDYPRLQRRAERLQRLPLLLFASLFRTADFRNYGLVTQALFETLAEVSGKRTLVDVSKYPGRALALARTPGVDLRLIHLVRDVRGAAYSRLKSFAKDLEGGLQNEIAPVSATRTAWSWTVLNLVSSMVMGFHDRTRRLRVRYEDLVGSPNATLDRIGELADLDMTVVKDALEADEAFGFGHTVAGNRVRMAGSLRLKPDLAWMEKLSQEDQRAAWRWSGPLMRFYGYQRKGIKA